MSDGEGEAGWVTATLGDTGFRTELRAGAHRFAADEPPSVGGGDSGPTPYDLLLGAAGACTAMTMRMYAARKGWPLEGALVRMRTARSYGADCRDCATKTVGVGRIEREVELHGPLTDEQRRRLLEIADRCPVKQTLARGLEIVQADS